ncbi:MAG: SemiSWEET transporter [Phycisphaerae bacterium]|jgi:MtN3 and saliva related transmembrane protein
MSAITILGILAGTLTTAAFTPQVVKSWRTRHTKDVSLGMFIILCVGTTLWLIYGLLMSDLPIILANAVTLVLATSILALKIRHG